ncbi:DUF4011 domain-containing protein [Nesterenkonia pannonica]|uniref:DUF4011 domain-containing protein n=1 Tax=Nesterenkonia pannonica TaxID=1548602 RepID=UPI0021645083|nr:DUF4011 domain-containing protein [Nesterenkonia pannonica]
MSEVDDVVTESGGDGAEVLSWIESFGTGTENDTMLRFTPSQHNAVDLTDANSSGLMQLLGGRRTRLSTLLNDSAVFTPAAKAAANIRAKIREMRDDRGIETGYMACGIASWTEHDASGGSTFTAPVMLIPVTLGTRSDSGDYDLQFTGPARLNPALARHMATVHGVVLSPDEFYAAGYVTARFDYQRTSALLQKTVSATSSDEEAQAEAPPETWSLSRCGTRSTSRHSPTSPTSATRRR